MSRRGLMRDTKSFVTGPPIFLLNLVHLWQLRLTRYISNTFIPCTSGSVYDFRQKRNPGPCGPSGNDDLDASELFAAQAEAKAEDEDEDEPGASRQSHPPEPIIQVVCHFIRNSTDFQLNTL